MSADLDYADFREGGHEDYGLVAHAGDDAAVSDTQPGGAPAIVDVMAGTRRLWHDYLAQFDIASAVLTVSLPGAGPQAHAFLIGLDHVRGNDGATRRLLAMTTDLWARAGDQPVHHFHLADADLVLGQPDSVPAGEGGDRPVPIHDCGIAIQMKRNGAHIRALFFRRRSAGRLSERDAASLQMIAPILADSASSMAQLARQSRRSAMLEAMFDRVSLSIALLSAEGQPLFMNSAALSLLDQRRWLIRAADGALVAADPQQAKDLRSAIRRAATGCDPVEEVFRLDCRTGDWRLAYVVSARSRSGDGSARCAMLIVMGPGRVDAPSSLLEALGLLPSEQRFLGHFLKSSSLGHAAEGCGLSEETARTYLKRVRAKLGVHRQMELAGLISGLVMPLQAAEGPTIWKG